MSDDERWKKLTQVAVESKDGRISFISQARAEELLSEDKIERVNVRDWVQGDDGKAHDTVVSEKLRWKK